MLGAVPDFGDSAKVPAIMGLYFGEGRQRRNKQGNKKVKLYPGLEGGQPHRKKEVKAVQKTGLKQTGRYFTILYKGQAGLIEKAISEQT